MNPRRLKVLFVCTGNTCRSPMAEHLFRKLVSDAGLSGIETRSAGVAPAAQLSLPSEARAALRGEKVGEVRHRPSGLDEQTVAWADLILTMERFHRDALIARFPEAAEKTNVLKSYAGTSKGRDGIADPYGGTEAEYRAALAEIKEALTAIIGNWIPTDPRGPSGK